MWKDLVALPCPFGTAEHHRKGQPGSGPSIHIEPTLPRRDLTQSWLTSRSWKSASSLYHEGTHWTGGEARGPPATRDASCREQGTHSCPLPSLTAQEMSSHAPVCTWAPKQLVDWGLTAALLQAGQGWKVSYRYCAPPVCKPGTSRPSVDTFPKGEWPACNM